jgi:hypothetical protein
VNLVNELQVSAERDDVLTVLRRAKRLASKLDVSTINDWIRCETDGYGDSDTLPSYRKIKATVVLVAQTPIPLGFNQVGTGSLDLPGWPPVDQNIYDSMVQVVEAMRTARENNRHVGLSLPEGAEQLIRQHLHPLVSRNSTLCLRVNAAQFMAIPETVKNVVLDWALELERKNVLGENQSFSPQEKQAAHTITFNIHNSSIEQLNNMGSNNRG